MFWIFIKILLKFVSKGPTHKRSALVQVRVWCQTGDKPLPKLKMTPLIKTYYQALMSQRIPLYKKLVARSQMIKSKDFINSLWPSDVMWHHTTEYTLPQVMACCLHDGTKPSPEPMLTLWHSPKGQFLQETL